MKRLLLTLFASYLFCGASYADCALSQFSGTWNYPLDQSETPGNATASSDRTWSIIGNQLTMVTHHNDSFGVYFQVTTQATLSLDSAACILTVQPTQRKTETFRDFDEERKPRSPDGPPVFINAGEEVSVYTASITSNETSKSFVLKEGNFPAILLTPVQSSEDLQAAVYK